MPPLSPVSTLLVEECYAAGDQRFVELVRRLHEPKSLAAVVNRWLADPRPWAREQLLRYLQEPFDQPGHAVVVKRIFKHAEKAGDDPLMAVLMTALDCLVRRVRKKRLHWDSASRSYFQEEVLHTPRNAFRGPALQWNPATRKMEKMPQPPRPGDRLFSYRTRYYLRRRVWRYFRFMGFQKPERYVPAVSSALAGYRDEDFQKGENYLDSWGFMHVCFGSHTAVQFSTSRTGFRGDAGLASLTPAPAFPKLWFTPAGRTAAIALAADASSRAVRLWAVKLLALPEMEAAGELEFAELRRLLFSPDENIRTAALPMLQRHTGAVRWTVAQWLELLEAPGQAVLDTTVALMKERVLPDRLDPAQCLELACARPVPVARLGFDFLRQKSLTAVQSATLLPRAAQARCAAVAGELTRWCLGQMAGQGSVCTTDVLSGFFDSLVPETRLSAWEWLRETIKNCAPDHAAARAWNDPVLWSRLAETPFDDLRLLLVDELARRAGLPALNSADLAPVWTSVLLGVHRGGRGKRKATEQIAAAIQSDHSRADTLLPVLAVAVRSVRAPEQRAGLAAVASLMGDESLTAAVQRHLPEVRWI